MRIQNWQAALAQTIEQWRFRPFAYGTADCFQLAADVVEAITGIDHRDRFPRYTTFIGATRIMARMGGAVGIMTHALGAPKPVALACRGDVVVGEFGEGLTAGICLGVDCCSPGERGLVFRKTATAIAAWSV